MGFLDMFDDPNVMSSLLGIPPTSGAPSPGGDPMSPPMPQPRPQAADATMMPMPQPDPRAAGPAGSMPPPSGMDPFTQSMVETAGGEGSPLTADGIPPQAPSQIAPQLPPPQTVGYAPGNGPGAPPMPTPDPRLASAPQVTVNAPMPPPDPRALPPNATPTGGVPMPPPSAGVPNSGGGLEQQIGASVQKGMLQGLQPGNGWQQTMAGLGKGLQAVGALRPGASVGQAIAAGAGGAMAGSAEAQEKQKQQLFANSTGAFKELLTAQQTGDKQAIDAARAKLFNAQATAIMSGRGKNGTQAWQNGPFGRVIQVENQVNKFATQQRLQIQSQLGQMSDDQRQKALADLDAKTEAYRQNLYKSTGIDPTQGEKLRNAGTASSNPIDASGWGEQQFNALVPMGAWYQAKGADGKMHVLQRTKPPGGSTPQQGQQASPVTPQENAAVLYNAAQE